MTRNPKSNKILSVLSQQNTYFLTVLFGSYARGEAYDSSDVDVLLIDDCFTGWNVHTKKESSTILDWSSSLPPLHVVSTSKDEFENRFDKNEEMVQNIVDEGYSVNEDFAFVDYIKSIRVSQS